MTVITMQSAVLTVIKCKMHRESQIYTKILLFMVEPQRFLQNYQRRFWNFLIQPNQDQEQMRAKINEMARSIVLTSEQWFLRSGTENTDGGLIIGQLLLHG
jgi:hypothetical protein